MASSPTNVDKAHRKKSLGSLHRGASPGVTVATDELRSHRGRASEPLPAALSLALSDQPLSCSPITSAQSVGCRGPAAGPAAAMAAWAARISTRQVGGQRVQCLPMIRESQSTGRGYLNLVSLEVLSLAAAFATVSHSD
eukprot:704990-Hanusia_phi.AAC.1